MEKWFEWIKKHIFIVVLIMVLLIIGIPFVIYISFRIPSPIHLLEAGPEWNEGVVLGYYGSILGFLGTVVLSMLALYQNQEIKKEADKRTEIFEREKHSPKLKCKLFGSNGAYMNMHYLLENISNNLADKIVISNFEVFNDLGVSVFISSDPRVSTNSLRGGEKMEFSFSNSCLEGVDLKLVFNVQCQDKFNNLHEYNATMLIANANNYVSNLEFEEK